MSEEGLNLILAVVADRGLRIEVDTAGNPRLRGPKEEATPALIEAVKAYRAEIVERFRPRLREWLWRTGHRHREDPSDTWLFGHADRHPVGAWWWRWWKGGSEGRGWKVIEGRLADVALGGFSAEEVRGGALLPEGEYLEGQMPHASRPPAESADLAGSQGGPAACEVLRQFRLFDPGGPVGEGVAHA